MTFSETQHLIWTIARTDFKLRYHGSILGYLWALLKPLLMFSVLNFVFTSIFYMRGDGSDFFSLQLLIGILMFNFFSEGTIAGMNALLGRPQLLTKIYLPRWTLIMASTINAAMVYCMNFLVIIIFCIYYRFTPTLEGVSFFLLMSLSLYVLIISFSLIAAPLYVRLRDLGMIWEVLSQMLFFAAPVMYPITMLPAHYHKFILLNPLSFVIHFSKTGFVLRHFPNTGQSLLFLIITLIVFIASIYIYKKLEPNIAEHL